MAVYVIYWKGPQLRKRSPFAQQLSDARAEQETFGRRLSKLPSDADKQRRASAVRANSYVRSQQDLRMRHALGSRQHSYAGQRTPNRTPARTPVASRRNSLAGQHQNGTANVGV